MMQSFSVATSVVARRSWTPSAGSALSRSSASIAPTSVLPASRISTRTSVPLLCDVTIRRRATRQRQPHPGGRLRDATAGRLLQSMAVAAYWLKMRECVSDGVPDHLKDGVRHFREPIMHPQALTPRVHEARSLQVCEMPRGFRLRDLER